MTDRLRPLSGRQLLVVCSNDAMLPVVPALLAAGAWVSVLPWTPQERDAAHLGDAVLVCAKSASRLIERTVHSVRRCSFTPVVAVSDPVAVTAAEAFEAGVDQWVDLSGVSKDPTELRAKLVGLLRRATPREWMPDQLEGPAGLLVHPHLYEAYVGSSAVPLTPTEVRVLTQLLRHRGKVLSAARLGELVWDDARRTVDVQQHVMTARRKLAAAGLSSLILTIRGVGYVVR